MSPQFTIQPNPKVPFSVVYEDEFFIALNKPAGVVTLPGQKHLYDSLLNGAFARWGKQLQNLGKKRDFGLLHRLDRGTSGIVLIALQHDSYDHLRQLFESRQSKKRYWAIIAGVLNPTQGICMVPIAEIKKDGRKQALLVPPKNKLAATANHHARKSPKRSKFSQAIPQRLKAQKASTTYQVIESQKSRFGVSSLIRCEPKTGRLHQIRIHMKALGSYVLGDFEYAGKTELNQFMKSKARKELALHAGQVEFTHPNSQQNIRICAPISDNMKSVLNDLKLSSPSELNV